MAVATRRADTPAADQITFIVVADSSRQEVVDTETPDSRFGYTYLPEPVTKYDVSVVVAEFDGTHDFPDRWWNLTAVINAIAGAIVSHIPVMFEDLSDVPGTHITVDVNNEGGTTTTYLVPSEELPLVRFFSILKSLEALLRASVERGYERYDGAKNVLRKSVTAAAVAVEEVEDTVTPTAETKVVAAVAEPVESVPANDSNAADEAAEAAEAASVEAVEAVEVEVEAEAVEAASVEAEGAEANDHTEAGSSDSSDDSGASDSE